MSRRNPVSREAIVQPPTEKMLRYMRDMALVPLAGLAGRGKEMGNPVSRRRAEALLLRRSLDGHLGQGGRPGLPHSRGLPPGCGGLCSAAPGFGPFWARPGRGGAPDIAGTIGRSAGGFKRPCGFSGSFGLSGPFGFSGPLAFSTPCGFCAAGLFTAFSAGFSAAGLFTAFSAGFSAAGFSVAFSAGFSVAFSAAGFSAGFSPAGSFSCPFGALSSSVLVGFSRFNGCPVAGFAVGAGFSSPFAGAFWPAGVVSAVPAGLDGTAPGPLSSPGRAVAATGGLPWFVEWNCSGFTLAVRTWLT